jgi:bifunctional non-homologous end joining protein LigD
LLVGREVDGALRFAGGVGTGFTQQMLEELRDLLRPLIVAQCPFGTVPPRSATGVATWVRPELRARVEIAEFTNDGLVRHASFVALL